MQGVHLVPTDSPALVPYVPAGQGLSLGFEVPSGHQYLRRSQFGSLYQFSTRNQGSKCPYYNENLMRSSLPNVEHTTNEISVTKPYKLFVKSTYAASK